MGRNRFVKTDKYFTREELKYFLELWDEVYDYGIKEIQWSPEQSKLHANIAITAVIKNRVEWDLSEKI